MIELKLVPDGGSSVPAEAQDNAVLSSYLENNGDPSSDTKGTKNAASSWRDVERIMPGHGGHIALRVPGEPTDYSGNSLDGIANAILNNISGLKAHPDGWQYVSE